MVESDDDLSTRYDNPNNFIQPVDDYGKVIKISGMILDVLGVVWIPAKEVGFGRDGPHSCIFTNCGVFRINCELVPGTWVRCIVMESKKIAVCVKPVIAPVHTRFVECDEGMKLVMFSKVEKDPVKPYTYICDYLGPITDDSAANVAPKSLWAEYEFGSDNLLHISKFHPTIQRDSLVHMAFLPTSRSCYQTCDGTVNSPVAVKWAEEFLKECNISTDVFVELKNYVLIRPTPQQPTSSTSPAKDKPLHAPAPVINPIASHQHSVSSAPANTAISNKTTPETKRRDPQVQNNSNDIAYSSSPEDFNDAPLNILDIRSKGRYPGHGNILQERARGRYRTRGNS